MFTFKDCYKSAWPSAILPVDLSHNFLCLLLCQDKDFLKPLLHKIHVNPPAEVSTSLKVYQGHTLEKTYMGEDFFWAITPMAGDYVLFKFDRPVNIERSVCLRLREIHRHLQGWAVMMAWWPGAGVREVQAKLKSSAAFRRIAVIHHSYTPKWFLFVIFS